MSFDSIINLSSSSVIPSRSMALNAHIERKDFDPDFVASLLSRNPNGDDVVDIVMDTGSTFSITHCKDDFIEYNAVAKKNSVQTVSGPTPIIGYGLVRWTLISEDGRHLPLLVPCKHVPAATARLLSPQDYCQSIGLDRSKDQFGGNSSYFWLNGTTRRDRFHCPIDPRSNLPIALAKTPCHNQGCRPTPNSDSESAQVRHEPSCACGHHAHTHQHFSALSVSDETNQNITSAQKDLLLWHWRLGHIGFSHLQRLMRPREVSISQDTPLKTSSKKPKDVVFDPCILPKNPSTRVCKPPLCAACQIARAKRRNTDVSTTKIPNHALLRIGDLAPGARVSMDQYESSVRGRLPTDKGKGNFGNKYAGGTIFCDHASGFIQCHHQVSLRAADTVISKRSFERIAKSCGIRIASYHGDNGIFKSAEFTSSINSLDQDLTLSAVGAHHQNGVSERAIRTVTEKARTMMQHAHLHWPDDFHVDLWPFALDYAVWLYNHTPNATHGWAPIELFCGTKVSCQHLQRSRVWGCPGYVLSPTLQDGKKIPKWAPKARRGQFLGFSRQHSSMIGLMRNLQTGHISPQFHVVYDELFTTVHSVDEDDATWIELFLGEREYYGPDEEEEGSELAFPDIDPSWELSDVPTTPSSVTHEGSPLLPSHTSSSLPSPIHLSPTLTVKDPEEPLSEQSFIDDLPSEDPPDPHDADTITHSNLDSPLTAKRTRVPNPRFFGDEWSNSTVQLTPSSRTMLGRILPGLTHDDLFLHSLDWDIPFSGEYATYGALNLFHVDPCTNEVEWTHPFSLGAKASNADTPTLRDIQRMPPSEIEDWYDAMDTELTALRAKSTMFEIPRSSVPKGQQINKSTWAFKRKRRPNGEVHKLKARFVVRGDLQILDESESTYSPVVDWSTVRLLFVLTAAQHLHSTTIDFNAAFVQSTLPEPIYLELPPGYSCPSGSDNVYQVDKSLYGDVRAAKFWYKHLRTILIERLGFTVSKIDSCLYYRDGVVFVFYVDDGIIVSHDPKKVTHFISELTEAGLDLSIEEDYAGYLGVDVKTQADGTLLLSQTGLIDRVISDLGLSDSASTKATPASEVLSHHKSSPPLDALYNYRSVLGKIMYLASNTRCDLAFANHQCARFSSDPREPHGVALKRIGRYLLGTREKGMIIRPTKDLTLDCYADADFAGLFSSSDPNDPKSVRSRSGFVITLGSIPVSWTSKLQTETALSTMESEYISLSQAMRVLLPLRMVLAEIEGALSLTTEPRSIIRSTIYEDNQACLSLATSDPPKLTPRSKSIAVKYHWFRDHLIPGIIDILPISTAEQLADIFTKPLSPSLFSYLRKKLLGW